MFDVRFFRGAGCDTGHYLVVAKVRERLAVSKQVVQKFNFRKLRELEVKVRTYFIAIAFQICYRVCH